MKAPNLRPLADDGSHLKRRAARAPSVTDDAIDKIRERIVSGAWGPGDRLPKESELAAELGLSRNSLREAVRAPGTPVLISLLASLSTRMHRVRLWHGRAADNALDVTREEHRRIYEAIMQEDPELARAAATAHIASGERWLRKQVATGASA